MPDGITIISRKLPDYDAKKTNWDFMYESYLGGPAYISRHLSKYFLEGEEEFKSRKERAHRENHCKRVIDLINSYLFQQQPTRETKDQALIDFHANIDGKNTSVDQFMRSASLWAAVFGRIYVVIDKPRLADNEKTGTAADDLKAQPYCYLVNPQDIRDIAFNEDGSVKWVIIVEHIRDDGDPFTYDEGNDIKDQYRLWMEDKWYLFDDAGTLINDGDNPAKCVPLVIIDNEDNDQYDGQSTMGDIAYLDRAIFNNWSRLDMIVCDQTFSQLIFPIEGLPIQDLVHDADLQRQYMAIATNRVLLYSAQAQVPPAYISPDASQAQFILTMIESQTRQLYASLGLKNEIGTEVKSESGVAKAWDFDKLNKLLSSKADKLEHAEQRINDLFNAWTKQTTECTVDYPEDFDVRSLLDEIAIVQELAMLRLSDTFTKEIEKLLAMKALPKADKSIMRKIYKEIETKTEADPENPPKTADFDFDKDDEGEENEKGKAGTDSA